MISATMTSCSTAVLATKCLQHRDFHKRFCRKVVRANGGFHPKFKRGTSLKRNFWNLPI